MGQICPTLCPTDLKDLALFFERGKLLTVRVLRSADDLLEWIALLFFSVRYPQISGYTHRRGLPKSPFIR